MTISLSDNDPRISYSVSAGVTQSTFTVPFEFFDLDDLNVYVDGTQKTKTTHYSLASGGSGATGSITMSVTGAAGGSTVVITRAIDHERTTDFQTSGPFNIASLNTELDRFTAIAADLKDDIDRSLRLTDFDSDVALTLPDVNSRKGKVLAFNASTGAVEAGPSTSDVQTVSATAADIAALADIEDGTTATDAISGLAAIKANVTTLAGIASNVTSVAGNAANINAVAADATDIGVCASNISDISDVAAKAPLITSDFISDLNTVAVTDVINDINTLATSDIVADLNTLASTDIVADLNTLATTDIVNDINTLATTDIVNDLNLLATSDFVADLNTMATTTNVNNLSTVSTNISAVSTAASSISEITSFNDLFSVSASAPSSPSAGDLWYDTANSQLKVYVTGSGWQVAGAYLQGLTSTHVFTCTANQTSLTTDDDGNTLSIYSNGNTLVFMNGVRLVEGSGSGVNDYYISGNTVNLNFNSDAGDVVLVEVFTKISTTQEASLNSLVSQASTSASNAATSESNAATSATNSANSATASASSASSASTSAATATTQASAASTSASNAATSESNAAASATSAASSAAAAAASANFEVVNDTTPSLGGDLDVSGNSIVSVSNGNIAITPNGTGSVVIDGLYHPQSDGTSGQFMKTDGSGNLSFATVDLTAINVSDDSTPSLGGDLDTNGNSILFGSSAWSIELDTGDNDLLFKFNGTTVFKLASNGAVTSANNVTAFGSP